MPDRYFVVRCTTNKNGEETKGVARYDTHRAAEVKFYQNLAEDIGNENLVCGMSVMLDYNCHIIEFKSFNHAQEVDANAD